MRTLPTTMIRVLAPFAPLFSQRVWQHVQVLLAGAILAPGRRTVGSALRAKGLDQQKNFHRYHRVLSRAKWSTMEASRILLDSLVEAFEPEGPLVVGVDETLERRQGRRIAAKGIYRDPVRSSHGHFVKTSALRWVCLTLLAEVPWASRVWALPFVCALAPSERYTQERGKRHKSLTDWAWQLLLVVRRWQPHRRIVAVSDGGYATLKLLDRCRRLSNPITFITRLRLDAALYEPAPPRKPGQIGRPRLKGSRLANLSVFAKDPKTTWLPITVSNWYGGGERTVEIVSNTAIWYSTGLPAVPLRWVLIRDPQEEEEFETQALVCTNLDADPAQIISWFVRRWQMETTFQELRQRLGFETQRHWSERAIRRTAPALLGLFSLVTLITHLQMPGGSSTVRRTAWYDKPHPTFSDALALVRKELWAREATFCGSYAETETVKVPRVLVERLTEAVATRREWLKST
ncbi:MAG TPA: transposase [Rubrobacter sp.]|nr:transposase [Rubrobacter sp.]